MLEYNLANAISKAIQTKKSIVGYASGNGEPVDARVWGTG